MNDKKSRTELQFCEITEQSEGQRLDNFLIKRLKSAPKSLIYRLVRKGQIRINGKRSKINTRLNLGDEVKIPPITLDVKPATTIPAHLNRLESDIIYEDENLLIINKPAGLAVHGGSGLSYGLIETLRQLRPTANLELVHRLDKATSGCLMVAKNRKSLVECHRLLREHLIQKRYIAIVKGSWSKKITFIDRPLLKNVNVSGERIVRVSHDGKAAETEVRVLSRLQDATLVELEPLTGRTHQLRVHCQVSDHPIGGDEKYGDKAFNKLITKLGVKRLLLHARSLSIESELLGQINVSAPEPDDFTHLINRLTFDA